MADAKFKNIIDHPEKKVIITRLVSGESPKSVAAYLRNKYKKDDEKHLKLPVTLLKDFIDSFGAHYGFASKIVKKNNDVKLDKQIADSLLENKEWRERVAEITDDEIDLKKKLKQLVLLLEARLEQVFDIVQSRPENTKNDYILNKYFELFSNVLEKADKIFNDKADIKIEHTYTIQMVEQQALVIQEAIRKVLSQMDPEQAAFFMSEVQKQLTGLKPEYPTINNDKTFSKNSEEMNKLLENGQRFEGEMEDFDAGS